MKRIEIGDVFEIRTKNGNAYFQFVKNSDFCELIRILPGLFHEKPKDISLLVSLKEVFFVHFPLKAAYRQGIVELIGSFSLPQNIEIPKQMRSEFVDKTGKLLYWHIVDCETLHRTKVTELTEEQRKLSPWGTWNDTLLIELLAEGWSPEKWLLE